MIAAYARIGQKWIPWDVRSTCLDYGIILPVSTNPPAFFIVRSAVEKVLAIRQGQKAQVVRRREIVKAERELRELRFRQFDSYHEQLMAECYGIGLSLGFISDVGTL